jgi:hypothetical protein
MVCQPIRATPSLWGSEERPFDIPWLVLDDRLARDEWNWSPAMAREAIFERSRRTQRGIRIGFN